MLMTSARDLRGRKCDEVSFPFSGPSGIFVRVLNEKANATPFLLTQISIHKCLKATLDNNKHHVEKQAFHFLESVAVGQLPQCYGYLVLK